jgi:plasmid stabilization system protein ParE
MTARVVILRGAEADLHDLRRYVARRFGEAAWIRTLRSIRETIDRIGLHPDAGRVPDEFLSLSLSQFREMVSGANRIVYERRGTTAYVHLICDGRRDLKAVLLRRLLEAR